MLQHSFRAGGVGGWRAQARPMRGEAGDLFRHMSKGASKRTDGKGGRGSGEGRGWDGTGANTHKPSPGARNVYAMPGKT